MYASSFVMAVQKLLKLEKNWQIQREAQVCGHRLSNAKYSNLWTTFLLQTLWVLLQSV